MSRGWLSGVRVLDVSTWRPGPYATQLLADLGADVLKVEPPRGDPSRLYPALFALLNAGKRSVVIDLKDERGPDRLLALARDADVLVEGFRPGVAARLGIGPDDVQRVNPSIVYCSISGYGQGGAMADVPGHDINYQAYAGGLAPDGGQPAYAGIPYADQAGGLAGAFAVCAALVGRGKGGPGERIDVSMTDVLATWTGPLGRFGMEQVDELLSPPPAYGLFATADGWVALGVVSEQPFWAALCDEIGLDDVRQLDVVERARDGARLSARIAGAIAGRGRDELVDRLLAAGVPAAPVVDRGEMLALPFLHERGVVSADGRIGHPVRLSQRPALVHDRAPDLDEHRGEAWASEPRST